MSELKNYTTTDEKNVIRKGKLSSYILWPINIVLAGMIGWYAYNIVPIIKEDIKARKYALTHLNPTAVSAEKFKSLNLYSEFEMRYIDLDSNGLYESVLRTTDVWETQIPITMDSTGKIGFPNLAPYAVTPLNMNTQSYDGLNIRYEDIDGDDSLESITRITLRGQDSQKVKIEEINGKYMLSKLNP